MTLRAILRRAATLIVVAACAALGGCATGEPPPASRAELLQGETFPYFKLYWAGRRFAGHAVTAVDVPTPYDPAVGVNIYYGDCAGRGGLLGEGRCQLPLQVTTMLYEPHSNASLGPQRNALIRGVPAVVYDGGHAIGLYSGHLQLTVFSGRPADALLAAQLLRPMNAGDSTAAALALPLYCPGLVGPLPAAVGATMARVRAQLPRTACRRTAG